MTKTTVLVNSENFLRKIFLQSNYLAAIIYPMSNGERCIKMMGTVFAVFELFNLVFWHSLTVSFIGWGGLAFAVFKPVSRTHSNRAIIYVLLSITAIGIMVIGLGLWSVGGTTNPHPSYLRGMACVYGYAAALSFTWITGQILRQKIKPTSMRSASTNNA